MTQAQVSKAHFAITMNETDIKQVEYEMQALRKQYVEDFKMSWNTIHEIEDVSSGRAHPEHVFSHDNFDPLQLNRYREFYHSLKELYERRRTYQVQSMNLLTQYSKLLKEFLTS